MTRRHALLAIAVLAGVSCQSRHRSVEPVRLRVSTPLELVELTPLVMGSSTAAFVQLRLHLVGQHFGRIEHKGTHVLLYRKKEDPSALDVLAHHAIHPALRSARVVDGVLDLEFADDAAAATIFPFSPIFDVGPYSSSWFPPDRIVLTRRAPEPRIDVIEVRSVPGDDVEWRMLLDREVDLLPAASPSQASHLSRVPSIRLVRVAEPEVEGLHCNLERITDPEVRRGISLALNRGALSDVVYGSKSLAADEPEDRDEARRLLEGAGVRVSQPITLSLFVSGFFADDQRLALAIQQQLAPLGVSLDIRVVAFDELLRAFEEARYDMVLMPFGFGPHTADRYISSVKNMSFYSNPDYDRALATGDFARASELFRQDMPMTNLYSLSEVVAIGRDWCGAHPLVSSDLSWIADVHLCKPGETE